MKKGLQILHDTKASVSVIELDQNQVNGFISLGTTTNLWISIWMSPNINSEKYGYRSTIFLL